MSEEIFKGFLLGILLGVSLCILIDTFNGVNIKSKQRIEPQLKITIEGGKSDTLFIYKKD